MTSGFVVFCGPSSTGLKLPGDLRRAVPTQENNHCGFHNGNESLITIIIGFAAFNAEYLRQSGRLLTRAAATLVCVVGTYTHASPCQRDGRGSGHLRIPGESVVRMRCVPVF